MLPFLDRQESLARLRRAIDSASLGVVYGRRRLGKSRLIREAVGDRRHVFYVGDDRESPLQRASLSAEIARVVPGFDRVRYPDWPSLLDRFWMQADGTTLVLDEFPSLVAAARELPSVLQKRVDAGGRVPLVLCGSSQRMMHGLVLDRTAPLFGRASEILRIGPLGAGWIGRALRLKDAAAAVEAYATWGGVPHYWELAVEHPDTRTAVRSLVLSPLGPLFDEPSGLLLDDLRDTAQAASILSLIGRGAHRLSEIAARLEKPATSLTRPLARLVELGLVGRVTPFGDPARSGKRSLYRIADPFLRFWFRFVDPNRSLLEARRTSAVERLIAVELAGHVAGVWEELARASVPHLDAHGIRWGPAAPWWGPGTDRRPLEVDVVAESLDRRALLVGETKWSDAGHGRALEGLRDKAGRLPFAQGRTVLFALWFRGRAPARLGVPVFTPREVTRALRDG